MSNVPNTPAPGVEAIDSKSLARPVRGWVRWLSVVLSVPVLTLCVLLPIARGEQVYRFLLEFRSEYSQKGLWPVIVACRWLAWLITLVATGQLIAMGLVVFRPRRMMVLASYVGLATLVVLFVAWGYYMLPSMSMMDALRAPAHPAD